MSQLRKRKRNDKVDVENATESANIKKLKTVQNFTLNNFVDDILIKILSFLTWWKLIHLRVVCRKWSSIIWKSSSVDFYFVLDLIVKNDHIGFNIFKHIIASPLFNPAEMANKALSVACANGSTRFINILLKDKRVKLNGTRMNVNPYILTHKEHGKQSTEIMGKKRLIFETKLDWAMTFICACHTGDTLILSGLLHHEKAVPSMVQRESLGAVIKNHRSMALRLLLLDGRTDPGIDSNKALVLACRKLYPDIVYTLLDDKRVDPSDNYYKPFIEACKTRNNDIISRFMKHEKIVSLIKSWGGSIKEILFLFHPSVGRSVSVESLENRIKTFLKILIFDDRVHMRDKIGLMFIEACRFGFSEIVQILLNDKRMDIKEFGFHGVIEAIEDGDEATLRILVKDKRIDFSAREGKILVKTVKNKIEWLVKLLIEDFKVDPSVRGNAAVRIASRHTDSKILYYLLGDPRVDPSVNQQEVLLRICEFGICSVEFSTEMVLGILLSHPKIDPSRNRNKALRVAVNNTSSISSSGKIVKLLLRDPRVDPSDKNQYVLDIAVCKGISWLVEILLKRKEIDPMFNNGMAFGIACVKGRKEIAKQFLNNDRFELPKVFNHVLEELEILNNKKTSKMITFLLRAMKLYYEKKKSNNMKLNSSIIERSLECKIEEESSSDSDEDFFIWK